MKNDWTDLIREEVLGTPSGLPDGDWDRFQARYRASRRRKWIVTACAVCIPVAAALVIGVTAGLRHTPQVEEDRQLVAAAQTGQETQTETIEDADILQDGMMQPEEADVKTRGSVVRAQASEARQTDVRQIETGVAETQTAGQETADSDTVAEGKTAEGIAGEDKRPEDGAKSGKTGDQGGSGMRWENLEREMRHSRRAGKVTLGAQGGLLASATATGKTAGGLIGGLGSIGNAMYAASPEALFGAYSPETDIHPIKHTLSRSVEYEHLAPIEAGISARYSISRHVAVQTGVEYTLLRSRAVTMIGGRETARDMQKLHMIGVPVEIEWVSRDLHGLSWYAGAGAMVEKCAYATLGSSRISERGLQLSANANAGLQYDFTRKVGIYLEPEARYYFTKTSAVTSRSQSPVAFACAAGLRFNLSQK